MINKQGDILSFGNDFYDVERIITRKYKRTKKYYLIKWVGYSLKECSWEPASNLENISKMVENFDNNFPNSIDKRQLKKYLRLVHKDKRNRNKNKKKLKTDSKNQDNLNISNLIIRINNSENIIEEEKGNVDEEVKKMEIPKKYDDKKEEAQKEMEIINKIDDKSKGEDKIISNKNNILIKIENEPTEEDDVPKLIKPIIIW